jgi:membrane peptidoglycan carboxypeptidase
MAHQAGVKTMWTDQNKPINLDEAIPQGRSTFDYHVGFGQYPISVLDHATGMATLAAHGVYHKPHFVVKVDRKNRQDGKWEPIAAGNEQTKGTQTIDPKVADEVTYVLKKIPGEQGHTLAGGRQVASKSGTWENGKKKEDGVTPVFKGANAHAWYVGYTEQIATAIWVGSKDHNDTPIKEVDGRNMAGAGLPGEMWEGFMNQAHKDMGLPNKPMTNGTGGKLGDASKGEIKPQPSRSSEPESPRPEPTVTTKPTQPAPQSPKPPPTLPPVPTPTPSQNEGQLMPSPPARPDERP